MDFPAGYVSLQGGYVPAVKFFQCVYPKVVVFSQDAHLLKLLLSDRGPEGVATWARDADLKLGLRADITDVV